MLPQVGNRDPYLCTYYAFMALLVVSLTLKLLWYPSVQLVTELNTVITRVVIYFNKQVFGYTHTDLLSTLETVFLSEKTLLSTTLLCTSFVLYLASADILRFAYCYFASLSNCETLCKVKRFAVCIIKDLLSLLVNKKLPKYKSSQLPF